MQEKKIPLTRDAIQELQKAGYAVVPLLPTDEMLRQGAPVCFQAYDGSWDIACRDAQECYQAMVNYWLSTTGEIL